MNKKTKILLLVICVVVLFFVVFLIQVVSKKSSIVEQRVDKYIEIVLGGKEDIKKTCFDLLVPKEITPKQANETNILCDCATHNLRGFLIAHYYDGFGEMLERVDIVPKEKMVKEMLISTMVYGPYEECFVEMVANMKQKYTYIPCDKCNAWIDITEAEE